MTVYLLLVGLLPRAGGTFTPCWWDFYLVLVGLLPRAGGTFTRAGGTFPSCWWEFLPANQYFIIISECDTEDWINDAEHL